MPSTLAYILHTRAWRETSLLVDVLTQGYGRMKLIAKGAKKPHSSLRGLLELFNAIQLEFTGVGSIKQIKSVYWIDKLNILNPAHILPAWYLNELCLYTLAEEDPAPLIFKAYQRAVQSFANYASEADISPILRQFEYQLLYNLGLWPDKYVDAQGDFIVAQQFYILNEYKGWQKVPYISQDMVSVQGEHLLALAEFTQLFNQSTLCLNFSLTQNAKLSLRSLMRFMLLKALHGKKLYTRILWQELHTL